MWTVLTDSPAKLPSLFVPARQPGLLRSTRARSRRSCQPQGPRASLLTGGTAALASLPAHASLAVIHTEPANALSLPTWAIHVSSVTEWVLAMWLVWQYAEATGNERWKGLTWGMMPLLAGALAACTYHFFYNSPDLDFLVAIQAFLTVAGNATMWLAAYRIYTESQKQAPS